MLPELPGSVYFDQDKLEKIVTNLISNAFKFTAEGSITLELKKLQENHMLWDGSVIKNPISFAVIDTGIGIPEDKKKTIFEAFQHQLPQINTLMQDLYQLLLQDLLAPSLLFQ